MTDAINTDTGTYTQTETENEALAALAAGTRWDTVSDAVDVHLGRIEREQSQKIDRDAIPCATVWEVVDTIVRDAQEHNP